VVRYLALEEVLVAPPEFDKHIIEALKLCEVMVTCPPRPVYNLVAKAKEYSSVVMSPVSVSSSLKVWSLFRLKQFA